MTHQLEKVLTVSALRWMLMAQAASLILHLTRLPYGLMLLLVVCMVWRFQIIRGRWRFPNNSIKVMLATTGLVVVILSFQKFSVLAAVSFLMLAYGLKLIELHGQRDAYISLFLSYLVVAIVFLFDTSLPTALVAFGVCLLITCALIAMHSVSEQSWLFLIKKSGFYWLSAVPLMVIFFVFFPRMPPLWSLDLGQTAKSGLSESISPGDIAKLTQSDELVFRANFSEGLPVLPETLYWRAFVLDHSDGRGWKRGKRVGYLGNRIDWYGEINSDWQQYRRVDGPFYPYDVILEPTQQPWLFSLDGSFPEQINVGLTQDFMLQYDKPVRQTLRYSSKLPTSVVREPYLQQWRAIRELQLPENENPRTKALAKQVWKETGNVEDFVQRVLDYFIENQFSYTLKPPVLGEKANDEFLFDTQKGFCGHYAGALALLARYAGIPARVVVGYLGGEWNSKVKYLTVRQYDAHAWAEVWVPEKGWTRVDPTAVIAPDRVERGLAEAMREEGSFLEDSLLSPHRYQGVAILDSMRLLMDNINYQWSLRVVGFDVTQQEGIFSDLIDRWGRYSWLLIGLFVLLALSLPFVLWGAYLFTKKFKQHKTLKQKFEEKLINTLIKKANYAEKDKRSEKLLTKEEVSCWTPREMFEYLHNNLPERSQEIVWLSKRYEELCYGPLSLQKTEESLRQWRFMCKQLKSISN